MPKPCTKLGVEPRNSEIFHELKEANMPIERCRRHFNTVRPHNPSGLRIEPRQPDLGPVDGGDSVPVLAQPRHQIAPGLAGRAENRDFHGPGRPPAERCKASRSICRATIFTLS